MREASVETYLRGRVKDAGGLCIKLNPAGYVGIPDRLVLLPGGVLVFVECKKPRGAKIARLQYYWRDRLVGLGFAHHYAFTRAEVDEIMEDFAGCVTR
jgi:hypothetical protein